MRLLRHTILLRITRPQNHTIPPRVMKLLKAITHPRAITLPKLHPGLPVAAVVEEEAVEVKAEEVVEDHPNLQGVEATSSTVKLSKTETTETNSL